MPATKHCSLHATWCLLVEKRARNWLLHQARLQLKLDTICELPNIVAKTADVEQQPTMCKEHCHSIFYMD
eukprot:5596864-Amphidinium_carterae.1